MKRTRILILLAIAAGLTGTFAVYRLRTANAAGITESIRKCNSATGRLRFSCYRAAIQRHRTGPMAEYTQSLEKNEHINFKTDDNSYSIFGNNCHTFYHALGDYIATEAVDTGKVKETIAMCPQGCQAGCAMGISKRMSLRRGYDLDFFKSFYAGCRPFEKHQCAHEIGHNLYDKYVSSILQTLDAISEKEFGLKPKQSYAYTKTQTPDLDSPFVACRSLLPPEELRYCYTGIGHDLFLFSQFAPKGYETLISECKSLQDTDHKDSCKSYLMLRIGINDAAPKYLKQDFAGAAELCSATTELMEKPELLKRCYLGLGGGIGFYVESEYLDRNTTDITPSDMQEILKRYARLCDSTPPEFTDACYSGLMNTGFGALYKAYGPKIDGVEKILPELTSDENQDVFFQVNN